MAYSVDDDVDDRAGRVIDFDIYNPPGLATGTSYHEAWSVLASCPPGLVWTARNGGHWIPTRVDVLDTIMSDHVHFANSTQIIPKSLAGDVNLLPTTLDRPAHGPYRMLLNDLLSPRSVRAMEEDIRQEARALVAAIAGKPSCDFTRDYAEKLPIHVFLRLMALPIEDAPMLKTWSDMMLRPEVLADGSTDGSAFARGIETFSEYLGPHIEARRDKGGADVLSRLVDSRIDGRPLSRSEALQLAVQLLIAGLDTVVNFLGFMMLHLGTHKDIRDRLLAPAAPLPIAVEELLRRFPIVVAAREAKMDVVIGDIRVRHGDLVAMATPLGAVDPQAAACPMTVDFDRKRDRHMTFGSGDHRCPGAHLARAEIRITLEEWFAKIPAFEVIAPETSRSSGGIVAVVESVRLALHPVQP